MTSTINTIELYGQIYNTDIHGLDLKYNKITYICSGIGRLQNLQKLNLSINRINNVCPEIGQLQSLLELDLSCNQINIVCPEIGQLKNLQELNLSINQINNVCPEIGQLQNLRALILSNNYISHVSPEIGLLQNLRGLILSSNNISHVFPEIVELQNLQRLNLSCNGNHITNICSEIMLLQNLQILDLSHNKITQIPNEIGQLRNLQWLNLCYNKITQICHEIGQLQKLQKLFLDNNQITIIPTNIPTNIMGNHSNYIAIHYIAKHNIPCVQRFLNQTQIGGTINIYNDDENIHKSSIKTIKNSIFNLFNTYYEINEMNNYIEDLVLTIKTKQLITKYISIKWTNLHFGCTFEEIFKAIWNEICTLQIDSQNKVKNRLNEEIDNSECKCYTGCISRLVNCLSGYSNKVLMKLSDAELIGNIIGLVKSKYIDSDIDTIKKIITDELIEYNFDQDVIEEWISYIVWIKSLNKK